MNIGQVEKFQFTGKQFDLSRFKKAKYWQEIPWVVTSPWCVGALWCETTWPTSLATANGMWWKLGTRQSDKVKHFSPSTTNNNTFCSNQLEITQQSPKKYRIALSLTRWSKFCHYYLFYFVILKASSHKMKQSLRGYLSSENKFSTYKVDTVISDGLFGYSQR